jgi:hypothetical protein
MCNAWKSACVVAIGEHNISAAILNFFLLWEWASCGIFGNLYLALWLFFLGVQFVLVCTRRKPHRK